MAIIFFVDRPKTGDGGCGELWKRMAAGIVSACFL